MDIKGIKNTNNYLPIGAVLANLFQTRNLGCDALYLVPCDESAVVAENTLAQACGVYIRTTCRAIP